MAFTTYVGNRECLLEYLTNLTPADTPMFSSWGKVSVDNHLVQWQTDTLRAAAANSRYRGEAYAPAQTSATTLKTNYTQIIAAGYLVDKTQLAHNPAGRDSELAYQKSKAGKELARDVEYEIVNQAAAVAHASPTTDGEFGGLTYFMTGNYVDGVNAIRKDAGAATLTKAILDAQLKIAYDNGAVDMDTLYANTAQKAIINGFPSTIRKMDELATRLSGLVNIYESEYGVLTCVKDRFLAQTELYVLNNSMWNIGVLRAFNANKLPELYDAESFEILGEITVICKHPQSGTAIYNLA
jgi:hypothetical protein